VSESDYAQKHALLCLRLAAECRDLAAGASTPELRAQALRMADRWEELSAQPAVEIAPVMPKAIRKKKMSTEIAAGERHLSGSRQTGPAPFFTIGPLPEQASSRTNAGIRRPPPVGTLSSRFPMARKARPQFDPEVFLATLDGGRTITPFGKDEVVFEQGRPADAVLYIRDGKLKILVTSEQGKEAVVAILGPGDFFGEGCLIGQPLRLATAMTITDCTIMRIGKAAMVRVLQDEPLFAQKFMHHLLTRNSRVEEDLVDQLFNSSEKRLARLLLLLANFGKEGRPEQVTTHVSQETLAEVIGTTRSRVSFFMNKFRKLGFIEYNGELRVLSSLLSVLLHD
jgi:CRP/FNR family transcriptional regulator, cyclic AMP receptor protein